MNRHAVFFAFAIAVFASVFTAGRAGAQAYVYTTLDDPSATPGPYAAGGAGGGTYAQGISGNIIVGFYRNAGAPYTHGFIYNMITRTYSNDDDPAGVWGTFFAAVSGNIVVGYNAHPGNPGDDGIIYNTANGSYTYLDDPGGGNTEAWGISGNTVVGGSYNGGFSYNTTTGVYTTLDDPSATSTYAIGISGNTIVGNIADANGSHGFSLNSFTGV